MSVMNGTLGIGEPSMLADRLNQLLALHCNDSDRENLVQKIIDSFESTSNHAAKFEIGEDSDSTKSLESLSIDSDATPEPPFAAGKLLAEEEIILNQMISGKFKHRELEKKFTPERAVLLRRRFLESTTKSELRDIPYSSYDYSMVNGACCENIFGYIPIPIGVAGPLRVNDEDLYLPLATTEGALVASINRGCKVLNEGSGVTSLVISDGMTRAPVIKFKSVQEAQKLVAWIRNPDNVDTLRQQFESTSRFARLQRIEPDIEGKYVYLRFVASTGDAMGMNMVSKAVQKAMSFLKSKFPLAQVLALSGNQCIDKKAAAVNWLHGRGKSVIASATIPAGVVQRQLKTTVDKMVELSTAKCLIGSSTAGTVGGWNAQAANIVAAMFLATGQDAAQVVSSSMCLTMFEKSEAGDLDISCTMKCLEVGTVGGGTILGPQQNALRFLDCAGPNYEEPGANARRLASIICAAVLAGEVSLMAALLTDDLVKSHMSMNRSKINLHSQSDANIRPDKATLPSPLSTPTTHVHNSNSQLVVNSSMKKFFEKAKKHSDCSNLL